MLPNELSEGLCSLKPNQPRLALVAKMRFDVEGNRLSCEMYEGLIESKRRATYTEVTAELDKKDPFFKSHHELFKILQKARNDRGSIDFDLPEAEVLVDSKTGEPIDIFNRPRLDAHRLIEEFMIAANEAATSWVEEKNVPFIFRVHEGPSLEALGRFQELANTAGFPTQIRFSKELSHDLSQLIRKLEGHPAKGILNTALLRSMRQAVYSNLNEGRGKVLRMGAYSQDVMDKLSWMEPISLEQTISKTLQQK